MADLNKTRKNHKIGRQDWQTPQHVFDHWNNIFNFTLDAAASKENALCWQYYTTDDLYQHIKLTDDHVLLHCTDGLIGLWDDRTWLNPPYGRGEIEKWVEKAYSQSKEGKLICCLLPVSTSSKWWQNYVTKADFIYYYPKRLRFGGATENATFDNAIVIFGLKP
ncbi:MAG: phage N-6-adenine-methyltransferase [Pseudomonadales bacterium]|nr:phage N-6-adenine-methyltransferase [Pseudomonadales bacterium]